jgi:hypothetical protein
VLEILILLSVATIALEKFLDKYWTAYLVKAIQAASILIIPAISSGTYLTDALNLNGTINILSVTAIVLVGLEVEHFSIKRWVKEAIFLSFITLSLTSLVSITMIAFLIIQTLLMLSKRNKFVDFLVFFIFTSVFCIYFSELSSTYINTFDKYIVFYNDNAQVLYSVLLTLLFTFSVITTWGKRRSSSVTPLLSSVFLLINTQRSVVFIEEVQFLSICLFILYITLCFRKYVEIKSISSAINVLFNISLLPILLYVTELKYDLALTQLLIVSIILYSVRLYNVSKFEKLIDFKTITIFGSLITLSAAPLSLTGINFISALSSNTNVFSMVTLVFVSILSWIILYFSFTEFKDAITFNLLEAKPKVQLYVGFIAIGTLLLMFSNLPLELAGDKGLYILRNVFNDCCNNLSEINTYGFNITLVLSLILFVITVYGLKIFNYDKFWRIKFYFIKSFRIKSFNNIEMKSHKIPLNFNSFKVIDSIGQSSSFVISTFVLLTFITFIVVLIE